MECGVGCQPHKTLHFQPRHRHPPTGAALPRAKKTLGPNYVCTNGVWHPLRPVSVAQKNKPSTMLSFNVQSIDLLMDCIAWWFWTMRQSIGCSTPAPRSSAAKQWLEQLAQKKKNQGWQNVLTREPNSRLPGHRRAGYSAIYVIYAR